MLALISGLTDGKDERKMQAFLAKKGQSVPAIAT
jgi:hypothetical protein